MIKTATDEKHKYASLDTDSGFCRDNVHTIHSSTYRNPCTLRACSSALHGENSRSYREETRMDISLFGIRDLERHHDFLGMQRNCRRRSFRDLRQCPADVRGIRAFPSEQEEIQRRSAIYIPGCHMDSMGEILFRRGDFMAMAGARQLICTHNMGDPMV